jgi:hypothetical protein
VRWDVGTWLTSCFDVCQVASLTQRMEAASQRADALTEQAARSGAAAEAQRLESVAALKRATEYARAQGGAWQMSDLLSPLIRLAAAVSVSYRGFRRSVWRCVPRSRMRRCVPSHVRLAGCECALIGDVCVCVCVFVQRRAAAAAAQLAVASDASIAELRSQLAAARAAVASEDDAGSANAALRVEIAALKKQGAAAAAE